MKVYQVRDKDGFGGFFATEELAKKDKEFMDSISSETAPHIIVEINVMERLSFNYKSFSGIANTRNS